MKFLIVISLALVATVGAEEDDCREKGDSCVADFISSVFGMSDDDKEGMCKDLRKFTDCLQSVADECSLGEKDEDFEKGLADLENLLKEHCTDIAIVEAEEDCSEEKIETCVTDLFNSLSDMNEDDKEGICNALREATDCYRSAVDGCIGEDERKDFEKDIEEIENSVKERCPAISNADDEVDGEVECLEQSEVYIDMCMNETSSQPLPKEELEMICRSPECEINAQRCIAYGKIMECYMDIIREKCEKAVVDIVEEELKDLPEGIKEACEAANDEEVHSFQLLDGD